MFKNITKEVLSSIYNYYYATQIYHDIDLPLELPEFDNIKEAININLTNDSICLETKNDSYFLDYANLEHLPKKIYDYLVLNNCIIVPSNELRRHELFIMSLRERKLNLEGSVSEASIIKCDFLDFLLSDFDNNL